MIRGSGFKIYIVSKHSELIQNFILSFQIQFSYQNTLLPFILSTDRWALRRSPDGPERRKDIGGVKCPTKHRRHKLFSRPNDESLLIKRALGGRSRHSLWGPYHRNCPLQRLQRPLPTKPKRQTDPHRRLSRRRLRRGAHAAVSRWRRLFRHR